MVQGVIEALAQAQLPPSALCLEITESALMDEPEVAMRHLERLSALGVKLAIDDYGSGMASLSYVKDLPVNELKIDRVFVSGVNHTPKSGRPSSNPRCCFAANWALSVVAEGAETQEEIAWLAAHGCDQVQGYGVAKPMPHDAFTDWLMQPLEHCNQDLLGAIDFAIAQDYPARGEYTGNL
jgi:EAL domain-containing protein (putative c-di-GMP-specific phosphodiesterase class I)